MMHFSKYVITVISNLRNEGEKSALKDKISPPLSSK